MRSNRDGFFAVYAGITARYPRFGYHPDANRRGTPRVVVETPLESVSDFSALGFHIGGLVGEGVPVFEGFAHGTVLVCRAARARQEPASVGDGDPAGRRKREME